MAAPKERPMLQRIVVTGSRFLGASLFTILAWATLVIGVLLMMLACGTALIPDTQSDAGTVFWFAAGSIVTSIVSFTAAHWLNR